MPAPLLIADAMMKPTLTSATSTLKYDAIPLHTPAIIAPSGLRYKRFGGGDECVDPASPFVFSSEVFPSGAGADSIGPISFTICSTSLALTTDLWGPRNF